MSETNQNNTSELLFQLSIKIRITMNIENDINKLGVAVELVWNS